MKFIIDVWSTIMIWPRKYNLVVYTEDYIIHMALYSYSIIEISPTNLIDTSVAFNWMPQDYMDDK